MKLQSFPFHLVQSSPWPLATSLALLIVTLSSVLIFQGINASILLIIGIISLLSCMALWWKDVIIESTYLGHHTVEVVNGIKIGFILFLFTEAFFFISIFWAYLHKSNLWLEIKLWESPKALITKPIIEKLWVALLMIKDIVTSLEIEETKMGDRGSKSDSYISVKEQRTDGFSKLFKLCKVCSKCQGNLVFMQSIINVNTIILIKKYKSNIIKRFFTPLRVINNKIRLKNSSILNPYYVSGFTDGEGCFYVGVYAHYKYKTGYRVKTIFQIGVHKKDLALLEQIKLFFKIGNITKLGPESVQFRISGLEDLNVIINHFDNYPLLTRKQSDYLLFKEVICLMKKGLHLTLKGLKRIISIKKILNNGKISNKLSLAFPNLEKIFKPKITHNKIKNFHWLAGFTDAEGCFFIALKKSPKSKLGETVWLVFTLSQHSKDKDFLKSLILTLNCGRYITKSDNIGEFKVEKFLDVYNKIIPIFEQFKLRGIKSFNFLDFKKAALLIEKKAHLTREGLNEIKKIKGKMNKSRK